MIYLDIQGLETGEGGCKGLEPLTPLPDEGGERSWGGRGVQ